MGLRIGDNVKIVGRETNPWYLSEEIKEFELKIQGETGVVVELYDNEGDDGNKRCTIIRFDDDKLQEESIEIGEIRVRTKDIEKI